MVYQFVRFQQFLPLRLWDEKPLKRPKTVKLEKSHFTKTIAPFGCQNTQYSPPWKEHFRKNHIPLSSNHFPLWFWHFVLVDIFPARDNRTLISVVWFWGGSTLNPRVPVNLFNLHMRTHIAGSWGWRGRFQQLLLPNFPGNPDLGMHQKKSGQKEEDCPHFPAHVRPSCVQQRLGFVGMGPEDWPQSGATFSWSQAGEEKLPGELERDLGQGEWP